MLAVIITGCSCIPSFYEKANSYIYSGALVIVVPIRGGAHQGVPDRQTNEEAKTKDKKNGAQQRKKRHSLNKGMNYSWMREWLGSSGLAVSIGNPNQLV